MRTIALEEHYATSAFLDGPGRWMGQRIAGTPLARQLVDLAEGRIGDMDAAGIDLSVLSLTVPGTEQLDVAEAPGVAREVNDALAAAVAANPSRLAGFAALPTAAPAAAARELERAVRELGFVGALINGHSQGRYLDDVYFWEILETAEALGVPLYLHPAPPPRPVIDLVYAGNYSQRVTEVLATAAWGWHIETATHVLRLILSGAFDRFPNLQLIVGHMGEGLAFMLPRFDFALPPAVSALQRPVSEYLRRNLHYTFSGFDWNDAFSGLLAQVGADRIMFSTDYPQLPMGPAREFLDQLPVGAADRERIAHGNAELLLGL